MTSPVKVWRRQKQTRRLLGQKGKIVTWTMIFAAGCEHKISAPYPVVLVKLESGKQVFGQLVDYKKSDLHIGQEVVALLRKVREPADESLIAYGIKFAPLVHRA